MGGSTRASNRVPKDKGEKGGRHHRNAKDRKQVGCPANRWPGFSVGGCGVLDMASLGHAHIERYAPLALRGTLQPTEIVGMPGIKKNSQSVGARVGQGGALNKIERLCGGEAL